MKTRTYPLLFILSLLLMGGTAHGQILTDSSEGTFDAATAFAAGTVLGDGVGVTQTFSGASQVNFVTYRFIAADSAVFAASSFEIMLTQWTGPNASAPVSGPALLPGAIIADNTSWTTSGSHIYFDATFDLSAFGGGLTPANTYGITIVGDAASANFRIAGGDADVAGADGFVNPSVTGFGDLLAGNTGTGSDFMFVGGATAGAAAFSGGAAVPEANTAAVLLAVLFVCGLSLRRSRHRRPALAHVG